MSATKEQRDAKIVKSHLRTLTGAVLAALDELHRLMQRPSTAERGKAIASVLNQLELANDRARYFGLGVDFHTDTKQRTPKSAEDRQVHTLAEAAPLRLKANGEEGEGARP